MNLKKAISMVLVATVVGALAGCGADSKEAAKTSSSLSGMVTASGSSALLPLAKLGATEFKKINPDVSITINGGGSGTGLKQVFDGTVNIGNSDVSAFDKLAKDKAEQLVEHRVAVVTVAPIANKNVGKTVTSLTKEQLQGIFTGKITNWKEVGGADMPIVLVSRPATSGTRALFKEFALDGKQEVENKSMQTDDSGTLMQTITQTEGSIGYVALPYLVGKKDAVDILAIDGVEPTLDNTYNGKYPVWGYERMYTKGEAKDAVKAYLDYMVSQDFGKQVEKLGYGVVAKMTVSR